MTQYNNDHHRRNEYTTSSPPKIFQFHIQKPFIVADPISPKKSQAAIQWSIRTIPIMIAMLTMIFLPIVFIRTLQN